jgi:hypothetical protein
MTRPGSKPATRESKRSNTTCVNMETIINLDYDNISAKTCMYTYKVTLSARSDTQNHQS